MIEFYRYAGNFRSKLPDGKALGDDGIFYEHVSLLRRGLYVHEVFSLAYMKFCEHVEIGQCI